MCLRHRTYTDTTRDCSRMTGREGRHVLAGGDSGWVVLVDVLGNIYVFKKEVPVLGLHCALSRSPFAFLVVLDGM